MLELSHLFPIFDNGKSRIVSDTFFSAIAFIADGCMTLMGQRLESNGESGGRVAGYN